MHRKFYISLPVKDLKRSVDFFTALGFAFNPAFASRHGSGMIVNADTSVMLVTEAFFSTLTKVPITDARKATEALLAVALGSRAEVDALVANAVAAGATDAHEPEDDGDMYQRGFVDLDGHQWGVFCVDESQAPAQST